MTVFSYPAGTNLAEDLSIRIIHGVQIVDGVVSTVMQQRVDKGRGNPRRFAHVLPFHTGRDHASGPQTSDRVAAIAYRIPRNPPQPTVS